MFRQSMVVPSSGRFNSGQRSASEVVRSMAAQSHTRTRIKSFD